MVSTRLSLILYFRRVAHKAACHTLQQLSLQLIQDDSQYGFARITDEADISVVLTEL